MQQVAMFKNINFSAVINYGQNLIVEIMNKVISMNYFSNLLLKR